MTTPDLNTERPCPACGYDLRALSTPQCPECGQAISQAALLTSPLPWLHRATLGTPKAFLRTAMQIVFKPWRLSREITYPSDLKSARQFALPFALFNLLCLSALSFNTFTTFNFDKMIYPAGNAMGGGDASFTDVRLPLWCAVIYLDRYIAFAVPALFLFLLPRTFTPALLLIRNNRSLRAAALTPYLVPLLSLFILTLIYFRCLLQYMPDILSVSVKLMYLIGTIDLFVILAALWSVGFYLLAPLFLLRRAGAAAGTLLLASLIQATCLALALLSTLFLAVWLPGYVYLTYWIARH